MKVLSSKLGLIAAAGLMAVTFAATANAQDSHLFRAHVPFSFVAGNETMPAGDYTIRLDPRFNFADILPTPGTGIHRVMLKSDFVRRPSHAAEGGLLTFAKYGDARVLRGVWATGMNEGHEVKTSKTEVGLARAAQGNTSSSDTNAEIR